MGGGEGRGEGEEGRREGGGCVYVYVLILVVVKKRTGQHTPPPSPILADVVALFEEITFFHHCFGGAYGRAGW